MPTIILFWAPVPGSIINLKITGFIFSGRRNPWDRVKSKQNACKAPQTITCHALTAILFHFCTGCLMVPLAARSSAGTDHFKDSAENYVDNRITVRAHLVLSRGASGHRHGQQENTWISNRIYAFHEGACARRAVPPGGELLSSSWTERHLAAVPAPLGDKGGPRNSGLGGCKTIPKHKENKGF